MQPVSCLPAKLLQSTKWQYDAALRNSTQRNCTATHLQLVEHRSKPSEWNLGERRNNTQRSVPRSEKYTLKKKKKKKQQQHVASV
jgi:hypothetical protein